MSKLDELEKKVSEIERLCRELSDKRFLEDIHDELCENLKKHQDSSGSHFIKEIVSRIEDTCLYDGPDSIADNIYAIGRRLEDKENEYDPYEYESSYTWKCHNLI